MTQDADVTAALARIEHAQATLHKMLRPVALSRLRERPPSGEWSPMEHVRHLIFAQQHHFSPYLPLGFRWSSAGVPAPTRTGERRLSPVGSDPATTIDDVFQAWARVHAVVRTLGVEPSSDVAKTWEKNLAHLTFHAEAIKGLIGSR